MDLEVIMALIGLTVAAVAAILGIWMERDATKPPRYAYALSILILMATGVGMFQSWNDHQDNEKMKEDMARVLQMLDKISQSTDVENPALAEFVKNEVAAQSRARPGVVKKLAQRVADEGGDANDVLSSYLPPSEVEQLQRQGKLKTKPPTTPRPAAQAPGGGGDPNAPPPPPARRRTRYGEKRADMAPPPPKPQNDMRDRDGDGRPDKPKDRDGDGKPDKVKDRDGDGKPDKIKDRDGDGKPDKIKDRDGDGKPDKFKDKDGDGKPDKPKGKHGGKGK